jgi:anti-sigma B factor antagonist
MVAWLTGCGPGPGGLGARLEAQDPADRIRAIVSATTDEVGVDRRDLAAALVDRLDDEDEAVCFFAIAALYQLTGERFGYRPYGPVRTRRSAVERWRDYVARFGAETPDGAGGTDNVMARLIKEIRRLPEGTVVEACGEIDLRSQPEFQQALLKVCAEKPAVLVIHLGEVDYMDSSGVGTLVKISHAVRSYEGRLVLVAPKPRVLSIFEITALDKYFTILATEQEALGS